MHWFRRLKRIPVYAARHAHDRSHVYRVDRASLPSPNPSSPCTAPLKEQTIKNFGRYNGELITSSACPHLFDWPNPSTGPSARHNSSSVNKCLTRLSSQKSGGRYYRYLHFAGKEIEKLGDLPGSDSK